MIALPVDFELPLIARGMSVLIDRLRVDPHAEVPAEAREVARRLLRAAAHLIDPAPREVVTAWMMEIVDTVLNPPSPADFEKRIRVIMIGAEATPAAVWNQKNLRLAIKTWRHWPAGAEVFALLEPDVCRIGDWEFPLCQVAGLPNRYERANRGLPPLAPALRLIDGRKDLP